jgi:hypothetical protein
MPAACSAPKYLAGPGCRSAHRMEAYGDGARKVSGWPKRCKLAHAFLWEYSCERLELAQFLGQLGIFLTRGDGREGAPPRSLGREAPQLLRQRAAGVADRPRARRHELGRRLCRPRVLTDPLPARLQCRGRAEVAAHARIEPAHGLSFCWRAH